MKKHLLLLAGLLLFSHYSAQAQHRQGTVFEVTDNNVDTIAQDIYNFINQSPFRSTPPSFQDILQFLDHPFNQMGLHYNPGQCSKLDLEVNTSTNGIIIDFGDDDGANPSSDRILMAALNYDEPTQTSTTHFNISNSNSLDGVEINLAAVQYQILMLARICDECSTTEGDCFSTFEIIIVDKHLL